ncbi:MAG: hypothetical protein A2Z99_17740 [Treponema sp. GWB1_62_6]|nr:MAG: hypothetical protein A2Y36_09810 [Treponema sp. GWA1_62_8]OHE64878.1 MAG: hypothetical protein A2001_16320 [Treponema sp. GWC1_61_84]OHE65026.1 MAG: hypothetical protein A2Z99_17740 [Treponema sp. GWB1_62_6]OHE76174.1 MAG: hypothetical protein A2413_15865 [Treponema sp. RIFOXYC1_FULL_61_9]HCM28136.1 aldo/keto reductase [Treponema sp.]
MNIVQLGRSGLRVSSLCLGTMTLGREADEETSFAIMDHFTEKGGTFLDTADGYSTGSTEALIGRWLKDRGNRDKLVLATKVFTRMGEGPNEAGLSRIHIVRAVDASLKRLGTDVIDLYQIHRWDSSVPIEETLDALDDLVRAGKVRYLGCSNLKAYQLSRMLEWSRRYGRSRFISLQPAYNALNRSIESELLPLCVEEGLGVLSYNPLAGGMLTGKYRRGAALPIGSRMEAFKNYHDRYLTDQAFDLLEAFLAAARERGVTPAALALAWVIGEKRITCPILGARTLDQLKDTLGGAEIALTAEEREAIPAIGSGRWVGEDPVYR